MTRHPGLGAAPTLALNYYARMALLGVAAFVFGTLQALVVHGDAHMLGAVAGMALAIGLANSVGAWILFRPVRSALAAPSDASAAVARIMRLPRLSAACSFLVSALVMTLPFSVEFFGCSDCGAGHARMLFYNALLMSIHALLMALFIYFLVDDYGAALKLELHSRYGWRVPPGGGGVGGKLLIAYCATTAGPLVLITFDALFAENLEVLQGLDVRRALLLDVAGAAAMTAVAIVFIRRGLLRPLRFLREAVERVDAGDLSGRAPVVSDDELGVLTDRFNLMVKQLADREVLRDTFGRYVPARVAEALLDNRGVLRPQRRLATVLFTDIEDFTRTAERLAPEQLVANLNEYFSRIVEIVERHGGLVTQIQGDALLVCYNVPLDDPQHATNAVRAALEIESRMNRATFGGAVRFITRAGISSGEVIAGPVGARHRLIYTVHGDAVNLAARLEALNKEYGTRILVAESTVRLVQGHLRFAPLGDASIRGLQAPIPVYTISPVQTDSS